MLQAADYVGFLETQFTRNAATGIGQEYYGLYSLLVEIVDFILYFPHVKNQSARPPTA